MTHSARPESDWAAPPVPIAAVLVLIGTVLAMHARAGLAPDGFFATWQLPDPDSWLRVLRVLELWQGAGWFDETVSRLNAPSGLSLHWTRPLDIMILLPAQALAIAFGLAPRDAVLLSGVWICPALHAGCAVAAAWAARAVWTGPGPFLAGLLVAANPAAGGYSGLGRADHHTLVLLAGLLALGAAVRAAMRPADRGAAWRAGAFAGFGVWVSPEALFVAAPVLAGFGALWVMEGWRGLPARGTAAQGLRASVGFAVAAAAGVALEHSPSGWLDGDYDKVSAQHVLLGALSAAVFGAAARIGGGPVRRATAGGAMAAAALGALLAVRPRALEASLAGVDADSAVHFVPSNTEMQPVDFSAPGLFGEAPAALGAVPAAVLALALALPGWRRDGRLAAALPLALALAVALPAALLHARFALDLAAPAGLLAAGLPVLALGLRKPELRSAAALLAMVVAFGTPFLGLVGAANATKAAPSAPEECGAAALAGLARRGPAEAPRRADGPILFSNSVNIGPELAWRTSFRLVGAPYHRGGEAIADTMAFFAATENAEARAVAARRQASLVLLCAPRPGESVVGASLLERLRRGEVPEWMAPVPLPGAPAGVRLFAVEPPPPEAIAAPRG